jgi:hypothetical protein
LVSAVVVMMVVVISVILTARPARAAGTQVGNGVAFPSGCGGLTRNAIPASAQRVTEGNTLIAIGYRQVSGNNQNPIAVRFDGDAQTWCLENYETGGPDSRGYGLWWDGGSNLYAVFSIDGGTTSTTFNTSGGWLNSYGSGGGPKVAVLVKLDPATGLSQGGTYISALLTNGRTNSLTVTALNLTGGRMIVSANTAFYPRNTDRTRMVCTGASPGIYTLELNPTLTTALWAEAANCQSNVPAPALSAPTGTITNRPNGNPTYTWSNTSERGYELAVWRADNTLAFYQQNIGLSYCSGNTCSLDPFTQMSSSAAQLYDGLHYAYVRVRGGLWSAPYPFTMDSPAPNVVQNLNVSNTTSARPTASWSLTGDGVYATLFRLVIFRRATFEVGNYTTTVDVWLPRATVCGGPSGTNCSVQSNVDLPDETDYILVMQTLAPGGYSTGGPNGNGWASDDFRITLPKPPVPTNLSVAINQGRPVITWDDNASAARFNVAIYNWTANTWAYTAEHVKGGNDGLSCSGGTCRLETEAMIFANGSYSVYVNAENAAGTASFGGPFGNGYAGPTNPGNTTEPGDFVLDFDPPILVTGLTASYATSPNRVNVSFNGVAGATWYNIWIGTANAATTRYYQWHSSIYFDCSTPTPTSCSAAIPLTLTAGTYYVAVQSAGPGGFSSGGTVGNGFEVNTDGFVVP